MRKLKVGIATLVIAAVPFVGAPRAEAMACSPDIAPACAVVAKVVCGVLAKGKPCLA